MPISADMMEIGEYIVIVGLFVQIAFFGGFLVVASVFHWRMRKAPTAKSTEPAVRWQAYLSTLYVSGILIWVRSLFRAIEYIDGNDGPLMRDEIYVFTLDGMLILIVMVYMNWFHPRYGPLFKLLEKAPLTETVKSVYYYEESSRSRMDFSCCSPAERNGNRMRWKAPHQTTRWFLGHSTTNRKSLVSCIIQLIHILEAHSKNQGCSATTHNHEHDFKTSQVGAGPRVDSLEARYCIYTILFHSSLRSSFGQKSPSNAAKGVLVIGICDYYSSTLDAKGFTTRHKMT